jgi:hypothetical protein
LSAITGIAPDDDDGEKAVGRDAKQAPARAPAARPAAPPPPAPAPAPGGDEVVTFEMAGLITSIKEMLAKLNAGDEELMAEHLKQATKWTDTNTKAEKWLTVADLPGVAKHKPGWIKGVHKNLLADFNKAFDEKGNPK